jgi:hypothetical protein
MKKRRFVNGILQGFWILQPGNPCECRKPYPKGRGPIGYNPSYGRELKGLWGGTRFLRQQPRQSRFLWHGDGEWQQKLLAMALKCLLSSVICFTFGMPIPF